MNKQVSTLTGTLIILFFAIMIVVFVALSRPTEEHFEAGRPVVTRVVEEKDSIHLALQEIYGNFDEQKETATWVLSEEETGFFVAERMTSEDVSELEVSVLSSKESNGKIYLLTAANIPLAPRISGAEIGVHLVKIEKGYAEAVYSNKRFANRGSMGEFNGDVEVVSISEDEVAFAVLSYGTGQGIVGGHKEIIAFRDDSFVVLFEDDDFYFDNTGADDTLEYSGSLSFVPSEERELHDIVVIKEGVEREFVNYDEREGEEEVGVVEEIYEEYVYYFKDGEYVLEEGDDSKRLWEVYTGM